MPSRILLVDDEENVLQGYVRTLRKKFDLVTAAGGLQGIRALAEPGEFAVVVSDMRMPGMDGVTFLSQVRERWPDTVRVMLTGNADQHTAIEAVNRGSIFRFLTKPCDPELLAATLEGAIRQHDLITAERSLLQGTLKGALEMVVDLLATLDPLSFGRAQAVAALAEGVGTRMNMPNAWTLGIASVLCQIGVLTLPDSVASKYRTGTFLNSQEREIVTRIPEIGANLIRHIPRMEEVAQAILYSGQNISGTGYPPDGVKGQDIPLGGRILRVVGDYLNLIGPTHTATDALHEMELRATWYDLDVLRALRAHLKEQEGKADDAPVALGLSALRPGQVLAEGVFTPDGLLLIPAGTRMGMAHLEKLRNFSRLGGVREPIVVAGG